MLCIDLHDFIPVHIRQSVFRNRVEITLRPGLSFLLELLGKSVPKM